MKKLVSTLVLISILGLITQPLALTVKAAQNEKNPSYRRGKRQGQRAAKEDLKIQWSVIDFVYGFTLGPIAVGHSLVSKYVLEDPELPDQRRRQINNRNRDFREGFKDGYFQVKHRNSLLARITGWIGWLGTWVVLDQMRQ